MPPYVKSSTLHQHSNPRSIIMQPSPLAPTSYHSRALFDNAVSSRPIAVSRGPSSAVEDSVDRRLERMIFTHKQQSDPIGGVRHVALAAQEPELDAEELAIISVLEERNRNRRARHKKRRTTNTRVRVETNAKLLWQGLIGVTPEPRLDSVISWNHTINTPTQARPPGTKQVAKTSVLLTPSLQPNHERISPHVAAKPVFTTTAAAEAASVRRSPSRHGRAFVVPVSPRPGVSMPRDVPNGLKMVLTSDKDERSDLTISELESHLSEVAHARALASEPTQRRALLALLAKDFCHYFFVVHAQEISNEQPITSLVSQKEVDILRVLTKTDLRDRDAIPVDVRYFVESLHKSIENLPAILASRKPFRPTICDPDEFTHDREPERIQHRPPSPILLSPSLADDEEVSSSTESNTSVFSKDRTVTQGYEAVMVRKTPYKRQMIPPTLPVAGHSAERVRKRSSNSSSSSLRYRTTIDQNDPRKKALWLPTDREVPDTLGGPPNTSRVGGDSLY